MPRLKEQQLSKFARAASAVLAMVGYLVLMVSSGFLLTVTLFHQHFETGMIYRTWGGFLLSLVFLEAVGRISARESTLQCEWRSLALTAGSMASMGLVAFLIEVYIHREQHAFSAVEWVYAMVGGVTLAVCFRRKHLKNKHVKAEMGSFPMKEAARVARRVLKPGKRPAVALGIMFGALALFSFVIALAKINTALVSLECSGAFLAIGGLLIAWIYRQRIIVGDDFIAFKEPGRAARAIRFADITESRVSTLAERNHPVLLNIYGKNQEHPALKIYLKSFRQDEVQWLMSLPELRLVQRTECKARTVHA